MHLERHLVPLTTTLSILLFVAVPMFAQEGTTASQEIGVQTGLLLGLPEGRKLEGAELERVTAEIAQQVRCPMCRGLPISSSPTGAAADMVVEVRELLSQGYTPDQVLAYFERTYGEFVLLDPKTKGNWALYLAPILMLLVGGGIVAMRMRAANVNTDDAAQDDDPELAGYAAQVRAATHPDVAPPAAPAGASDPHSTDPDGASS
jgi:cytochrome c-type biogenesis protein CcmH